ncbi:dual specificity protein kinase splB isoform X1 [Malaya genurostris]|uniref:dual specificity protein kinase splB isoform X1 n=1 Tax=Malaya genurostris TaxID=325434 RepID=UPI0026F3A7B7|nr:dual specificity protein kinase splB isoform X1 [Malaya genurostris]
MPPSQKVTKKWEIFAGRNKFYCDGYLMTAPNSGVFYFTVVLITGTSGLFFAVDCPFLAERITPAIPIIGGILFVFTMSSLFRTSFSDPGIIPRASQDEAAYIEKQIEVPNSLNSPTYRPPPRTKEVFVKGQTVKLKYCFTCKIFRPPRASHCSLCDNCVDRFDHHCPWVGNCVGKRNYRFFYMFIVSLAFLAVFIFSCTTTHIVLLFKDEDQFFDIVKKTPFSVIIAIICFCSVWSVIGLAGFHTYLTTSDQTTNEDIKGSFTSKGGQQTINPYSQGNICLNCFHILCGPITPSLIDRRGVVTDEYRTQMQPPDKYNNAPVPPLVVMQPGLESINKSYNLENENSNAGVFRQRSYDNLQNGKSPSIKSSLSSINNLTNLNVTNSNHLNTSNNSSQIKNVQLSQSPSQYNNLSLSYVNHSQKPQPKLYHSATCNVSLSNFMPTHNTPMLNNDPKTNYQPTPRCLQPQHHLAAAPIPTNFKYFAPQSKYNTYSESQNQLVPQTSTEMLQNHQSNDAQQVLQHQQQQQQINININLTLPRYPYHKNRAIGRKSPQDLQLHDQSSKLFYSNHAPYYSHSSTNSLNTSCGAPSNNNLLVLSDSSSSSTTTISSTTSTSSSMEQSLMLPSGSSSYLNSYDTISEQLPTNSLPHTCPGSPRVQCASPSCSELDPMLQKTKQTHHKNYKLYKHKYQQQQQQTVHSSIANAISPQSSFSQFSPSFWSANSNRSSVISTGTLGSIGFAAVGNGSVNGGGGDCNGSILSGGNYQNYGGVGVIGSNGSSPYAQRRADKQRFSNVYDYKFNNFDLNSIHEDATNET